jgi:hypothetical protein
MKETWKRRRGGGDRNLKCFFFNFLALYFYVYLCLCVYTGVPKMAY